MSVRFPVKFPNGETYEIGGEPIADDATIQRLYPELYDNVISKDLAKITDDQELRLLVYHIVKHFNPTVQLENFVIDAYVPREVLLIWLGRAEQDKKKE